MKKDQKMKIIFIEIILLIKALSIEIESILSPKFQSLRAKKAKLVIRNSDHSWLKMMTAKYHQTIPWINLRAKIILAKVKKAQEATWELDPIQVYSKLWTRPIVEYSRTLKSLSITFTSLLLSVTKALENQTCCWEYLKGYFNLSQRPLTVLNSNLRRFLYLTVIKELEPKYGIHQVPNNLSASLPLIIDLLLAHSWYMT